MKELIESKLKAGDLKQAISIFLKWEIINNDIRSEIILHSARHNSAYRDFLKGVMSEENYKIENNRIILALTA